MAQKLGLFYTLALKFCPGLAFVFSILVDFMTFYISQSFSPIFIFISIQVYLNWYSIYKSSSSATTIKDKLKSTKTVTIKMTNDESPKLKYWYCDKCCFYTYKPTQHCNACKKCYHHRDHHCFFIGSCILQKNMGNFILICFYTSMACFYSLFIIGPFVYKNLADVVDINNLNIPHIFLNFCFPIALAKYFINGDINYLLLVTFF